MFHMNMLFTYKLHSNYEIAPPTVGALLYPNYVEACNAHGTKASPHYLGKVVGTIFPGVVTKRVRNEEDWTKFQRKYMGLKALETDVETDIAFPDVAKHLLEGMFVMESGHDFLLIASPTAHVCQGNKVLIELKLWRDLRMEVSVGTKRMNPRDYGIWEVLPNLSGRYLQALFLSLKSIQICRGKQASTPQGKSKHTAKVYWHTADDEDGTKRRIQSDRCTGFLTLVSQSEMCVNCQKLFRTVPEKPQETDAQTAQTPLRTKPAVCDASVGTTPLKTTQEVLRKFFPKLQHNDKLLSLLSDQILLAEKEDPRGRRYEKDMISLALTLWTRCPQSYQELIKAGYIFPSPRTLSLYKNCVTQRAGLNKDMFRWMLKEAQRIGLSPAGYIGGLALDEMNIQKDLQISTKDGDWKMVGLTDMGEGSNAMAAMSKKKSELQLADHVMQFLFHGMTGYRMPFACYPTSQANASDIYLNMWAAISNLSDWGFETTYISFDGSSNNRSLVKMLFEGNPLSEHLTTYNRSDPAKQVTFLPDPSHMIKKIRNSAFNSGHDTGHTRLMKKDGKEIIWRHWEDAWAWCKDREVNPVAPHRKLTKDYIYLTTQGKMRNQYADETLNDSMLLLMEGYQQSLAATQATELEASVEFLKNTSVLVRNFKDPRPLESTNDPRLLENRKVLEWFLQWEQEATNRRQLMSAESREDLGWMIVGFEHFVERMVLQYNIPVPAADINSDIIENFFCSQRSIKGGNRTNPQMHNYLYNINSIVLGQPTVSTKSNTGGKGQAAAPYKYTTPGPLRKKSKRNRKLDYQD